MYCAAREDNLDIDLIRWFCLLAIVEEGADCTSWELALKLNLPYRAIMLAKLDGESLLNWLNNSSDEDPPEYFAAKDSEYEVPYLSKTKPILSMRELCTIVARIHVEFNDK